MSNWKKDFDLSEPVVIVRLMAGLFYIPHILFKLMGFSGSVAAFGRMGFEPALYWLLLAILVETICVVGLTLNLYTHFVGLMSAGTMALAVYGTFATKGMHWMWNFGGIEYLAFWGIASLALAVQAWKAILAGGRSPDMPVALAALRP
jgi:putative oxidoreductase